MIFACDDFSGFVDTCGTGKRNRAGALVLGNGSIRISEFQFFAHSKGSGMNKLRFFFFTEYDILQINIFVTIFWKPHRRLPKSE